MQLMGDERTEMPRKEMNTESMERQSTQDIPRGEASPPLRRLQRPLVQVAHGSPISPGSLE